MKQIHACRKKTCSSTKINKRIIYTKLIKIKLWEFYYGSYLGELQVGLLQ
jgi:hypothetical protein